VKRRFAHILMMLAGLAVCTAGTSSADPIRTVRAGVIEADRSGNGDFVLQGDGFFLLGTAVEGIGSQLTCTPCAPGDTVPAHSRWAGDISGNTSALVDGTASNVWLGGDINLDGGTFAIPSGGGPLLTLQRPFSLAPGSTLTGFSDSARTMPVFNFDLAGSGIVTLTATRNGMLYDQPALTWVFGAAGPGQEPGPVPEPGTMLLMLSGLGAMAATRRRMGK
jgi:hypothetical protein